MITPSYDGAVFLSRDPGDDGVTADRRLPGRAFPARIRYNLDVRCQFTLERRPSGGLRTRVRASRVLDGESRCRAAIRGIAAIGACSSSFFPPASQPPCETGEVEARRRLSRPTLTGLSASSGGPGSHPGPLRFMARVALSPIAGGADIGPRSRPPKRFR